MGGKLSSRRGAASSELRGCDDLAFLGPLHGPWVVKVKRAQDRRELPGLVFAPTRKPHAAQYENSV
jgi:hypothetical protein